MKILITGGNGYLAKGLCNSLINQYDITCVTRQDFDLTAFQLMNQFFEGQYFDVVIHCAVQGGSRLKEDSYTDMDINLAMYYNLLQHKHHYGKLIHFGSGAEFTTPESPYGLSKRIIAKSISEIDNFFNLRIYNVFGPSESPTRFIRSNLERYINRQPMIIHQDKFMDFFYIDDLITLVSHYICNDSLAKEANCNYGHVWTLSKIASLINTLDDYTVEIEIQQQGQARGYYHQGVNHIPNLKFIGLQQGIVQTFKQLK
jgi:nucleoside-diphosphate-sugar epimerase